MKKKILIIALLIMFACTGCEDNYAVNTSSQPESTQTREIDDVTQYSRISRKELKQIMGKPSSKENWTNKTSKGNFAVTTYSYDKDSLHYEFIIADNSVVRLSIYSNNYWNGNGERFHIDGAKEDICKSYGIVLGDNAKLLVDNGISYIISPVNDKVAAFNVQDIDSGTYGFVKITYNLNYFD